MGLELIRYCTSYGTFNAFRHWLFDKVKGDISLNLTQWWQLEEQPTVPAMAFFNHSDCEGILSVEDCKEALKAFLPVYDEFLEIAREELDEAAMEDFGILLLLILDLSECVAKDENLEFC